MIKLCFKVMLRGHDHESHDSVHATMTVDGDVCVTEKMPGDMIVLDGDHLHTVNPGALFHGKYAIMETFDNKNPSISFMSL